MLPYPYIIQLLLQFMQVNIHYPQFSYYPTTYMSYLYIIRRFKISYAILNGNISSTWKFVILTEFVFLTLSGDLGTSSFNIIHLIYSGAVHS